jgi:hypothetical protein
VRFTADRAVVLGAVVVPTGGTSCGGYGGQASSISKSMCLSNAKSSVQDVFDQRFFLLTGNQPPLEGSWKPTGIARSLKETPTVISRVGTCRNQPDGDSRDGDKRRPPTAVESRECVTQPGSHITMTRRMRPARRRRLPVGS